MKCAEEGLCGQGVLHAFDEAKLTSQVLRNLTTQGGRMPRFNLALTALLEAADWEAAAQQGRIVPNQVMYGSSKAWTSLSSRHC